MTIFIDLAKRVREQPTELIVDRDELRFLAEHVYETQLNYTKTVCEIEHDITNGKMQFMGVPVKVKP